MSRTSNKKGRIKRLIHSNAILVSHGLISAIVAVDIVLDTDSSYAAKLALGMFLLLIGTLGFIRFVNLFNINSRPALHITLYYLIITGGIIFFAPIGSTFAYAWLIVLFLTYFYYGLKATAGSLLVFAVTLELQLLWRAHQSGLGITREAALSALVQLGIVCIMAMFFVDTETTYDYDQDVLKNDVDKAQLEHERILSLMNSMNDGVIATNEKGLITLYNASALNLLDTNRELTKRPINDLLKLVDSSGKSVDIIGLTAAKHTMFSSRDFLLKYENDEQINVWINVSPIHLGFQRVGDRGYIITFRDITREKSLEEERDEFISVISHELRTPIAITEANVSNAIYTADNNQDIDSVKKSLHAAHDQVLYLASMLNDLSTLSRAERNKLDLNPEPIKPQDIIDEIVHNYELEAKKKKLELLHETNSNTPETIVSNALYVREILQNFVTNAIKYTREGSVKLKVEGAENGVRFTIDDTGIGISKSDQKKIFDKFYRASDFRTRESSGTGLGLYITKKLAKIIGATFEVNSTLDKGSSFSVFIPDLKDQAPKKK